MTFHGFGPFDPTSAHRRAAGAGRKGALCTAGPSPPRRCGRSPSGSAGSSSWRNCASRPAAAAAVRVRGGAGAALRRVALPRRALGPSRAALDAAALPVVGRRPSPARAWLARAADRRAVRGGPEPPGTAAQLARRVAYFTELAALPAAADWPSLKKL